MMVSQDSTGGNHVGESHAIDMVHTSPSRKQRLKAYEKVDKLHTFRHRRLQ
jgi:hypothetical protein